MASQIEGAFASYTAGEALTRWRRVKFDASSGDTIVYADADDIGIGIAQDTVASGAYCNVKLFNAGGTFKVMAAGALSAGDELYGADDGKVDDAVSGGPAVLKALDAASGDGSVIEAIYVAKPIGLLYAQIADSAEVENTTTETTFDVSTKTIDGGSLRAGDVIEVIGHVFVLDNNSTDTLTCKLYFGDEEIVTTGAVDVADNDIGFVHAFITIRTAGASGTLAACGTVALGVPGTVTAKPWRKDQATEDMSGDVEIALKGTWSVAHADNEAYSENFIVRIHRQ